MSKTPISHGLKRMNRTDVPRMPPSVAQITQGTIVDRFRAGGHDWAPDTPALETHEAGLASSSTIGRGEPAVLSTSVALELGPLNRRQAPELSAILIESPPRLESAIDRALRNDDHISIDSVSIASAWVQVALDAPDVILIPWTKIGRVFVKRLNNLPRSCPPVVVFSTSVPNRSEWSAQGVAAWIEVPKGLGELAKTLKGLVPSAVADSMLPEGGHTPPPASQKP